MKTLLRKRRWAAVQLGVLGFLCIFCVTCAWSFATPLFGAPDEPAHVIKAAATAHGHFTGARHPGLADAWVDFTVPATIADATTNAACFAFHPDQSAACAKPLHSRDGSRTVPSYVGRYPPLYYLLVGLPTLVMHSPGVLYLMRMVSALLTSAFLALSFLSAAASRRGRGTVVGAALAVTPMVIFLGSVVNPSGLEIASALCFWVSALVLFTDPQNPARRALLIRAAIAAGAFMQTRGLSPLLLAIAGLSVAIIAGWSAILASLRRRDIQITLGVLGILGVGTLTWIFADRSLTLAPVGYPVKQTDSDLRIAYLAVRRCLGDLDDMIGMFGWKDTPLPLWAKIIWGILLGVAVLGGIAVRQQRGQYVLPLLCIVIVVLPAALSALHAREDGLIGQARYLMPVAVGIPVIACFLFLPLLREGRRLQVTVWTVAALTTLVQAAAFVYTLRRYRGGIQSPLLRRASEWAPPGGTLPVVVFFALALVAYTLWWRSLERPTGDPSPASPSGVAPEPARLQSPA